MDRARVHSRRTLLGSIGTTASVLLAGCSTSSDDSDATPSTPTATTSPTQTETPAAADLDGGQGPLPEKAWPLPHRGLSNASYLPDGPQLESEPDVDWQIDPTAPPDQPFTPDFTIPVIADGRLFTVKRLWFGPNQASPEQHFLRSYGTTTGDERWEFPIRQESGRSVPTRPAIGDGVVMVGEGQHLHAVDIADGNEVWGRTIGQSIDAIYPTRARTYVKAHRSIVALDANAERVWTKEFDAFPDTLARGSDTLYATVGRRLLALDPATGDVRWQQDLPEVAGGVAVHRLVTVADGLLAVQHSGDLYAFTDTGKQVWHADDRFRSLATDGSRAYARTGSQLRALAVPTGTEVWTLRCDDVAGCESGSSFRKPVVTDGVLYASHSSGGLVAVRPTSGTVLWTLDAPTDFDHLALGPEAIYGVGFELDPLVRLQSPEG